ncbi:7-carboxy-7-deazaguanine synthase QueE [Thermovibrio sp.]
MRICEIFKSIQGEGLTVGTPSLFIRTGRCSVGCKFCDTKYSWNSGVELKVEEVLKELRESSLPSVVITGGEPFEEEELPLLIEALGKEPYLRRITVETCGYIYKELPKEKLYLVISPKPPTMGVEFPEREILKFLKGYERCELKFTLFNELDLKVIKEFLIKRRELLPDAIVLQPLNHPEEDYPQTCKRVIKMVEREKELLKLFDLRVIPQIHKLLGIS